MYRFEGMNLLFSILGLMAVFYLVVVFSPVMILFLILAIAGYGVFMLVQSQKNKMFRKNAEKFDEKGRKITEATVLEITDDEESAKKN